MWLKAIKWLGFVAVALGMVWGVYSIGAHAGASRVSAEWKEDALAKSERITQLERETREKEKAHAQAVAAISDALHEELNNVKSESERIIADLRDGNRVLRDRFQSRPACSAESAPGAGGSDEASPSGLLDTDVRFLISIAAEADAISKRLTACQNILKAERQ